MAWSALPQCIGIWLMGACITALDCMLKLSSSENALKVDLDYNHEMQAATPLSFCCRAPAPLPGRRALPRAPPVLHHLAPPLPPYPAGGRHGDAPLGASWRDAQLYAVVEGSNPRLA